MDKLSGSFNTDTTDTGDTTGTTNTDDLAPAHAGGHAQDRPQDSGQPVPDSVTTVAQAAALSTQHVAAPPVGEQVAVTIVPGVEYDFDFHRGDADFVFSDGNLIILVHGGGEIILENFGADAEWTSCLPSPHFFVPDLGKSLSEPS